MWLYAFFSKVPEPSSRAHAGPPPLPFVAVRMLTSALADRAGAHLLRVLSLSQNLNLPLFFAAVSVMRRLAASFRSAAEGAARLPSAFDSSGLSSWPRQWAKGP